MATTNDIASNIVNALYVSDPEIDASIGTPIRKVIDAVSEQMSLLSLVGRSATTSTISTRSPVATWTTSSATSVWSATRVSLPVAR